MTDNRVRSYRAADLCAELERRARNGEPVMRHCYLAGQRLTFYHPQQRDRHAGLREGSQRWLALRTVHTTRELMREIQDRIARGDYNAYLAFQEAQLGARISLSWR